MRLFCVEAHSFVLHLSIDLRDNFTMSSQCWLIFKIYSKQWQGRQGQIKNNNSKSISSPFSFHHLSLLLLYFWIWNHFCKMLNDERITIKLNFVAALNMHKKNHSFFKIGNSKNFEATFDWWKESTRIIHWRSKVIPCLIS